MNSHSILQKDSAINFIFSAASGLLARSIEYPYGVLVYRLWNNKGKVRSFQQLQQVLLDDNINKGISDQVKSTYSGFFTSELRKIGTRTFTYGFQPLVANQFSRLANLNEETEAGKKIAIEAAAGASTRMTRHFIFYPLETIKVRRQNGNKQPLPHIVKTEKLQLYNGASLAALNKATGSAILFGVSAAILRIMGVQHEKDATFTQIAISSNIASAVEVLVTEPISVVQSRLQESANPIKISTLSMFKTIMKEEGVLALYEGVIPRIITSFPRKALPLALSSWMMTLWSGRKTFDDNQTQHLANNHAGSRNE